MKKKFKVTLVVFLVVVLGCFSQVFAANNQDNRANKISEVKKSIRLLDSTTTSSSTQNEEVDQYTELLMHMDNGTFKDECGHTVTNNGVTVDTSNKKFGDGSASFNGSNSYLTIPYDDNLYMHDSADYTIDFWMYGISNINGLIFSCGGQSNVSYDNFAVYAENNKLLVRVGKADGSTTYMDMVSNNSLTLNVWNHVAIVKQGKTLSLYINGVLDISKSINISLATRNFPIYVGEESGQPLSYFNGILDELRVSNIARWTSNFTPPTEAYGIINTATGISLNKTTDSLILNNSIKGTDTLIATVTPNNVTNKTVKWTSSDPTIVNFDDKGNITALKAGTATITATTTDGSNLSASCVVTVNEPASMMLDKTTDVINVGDTDKITASVTPAGQAVAWSSSDKSIATVDSNGNVTGIKAGTVVITATTADGKTVSCTVTVKNQETGKSKLIIYMGNQVTREYYLTDDEIDDFINWYDARANDKTPKSYYVFNVPAQGSLPVRKDYVLFDKIKAFEVE